MLRSHARRKVPLADAVGRVAAELVCPYPPGIPVILPGERVAHEAAAYVASVKGMGCRVAGLDAHGRVFVLAETHAEQHADRAAAAASGKAAAKDGAISE
jgi:arginine/lysine/ornithine decarboxylase